MKGVNMNRSRWSQLVRKLSFRFAPRREVRELLGHKSLETTMIYTHVVKELGDRPQSPLDAL